MEVDIFDKDISKKLRIYKAFNNSNYNFCIKRQSKKYKKENIYISHEQFIKQQQLDINNKIKKIKEKYKKKVDECDKDDKKIKEFKTKEENEIKKVQKVLVSRSFIIHPNKYQKQVLDKWNDEAIKVYNKCIDIYNMDKQHFNTNYMGLKLVVFKEVYGDNKKDAPYDILTDVVKDFCANVKSCRSNDNINKFEFKYRVKENQHSYSLSIQKKSLKENGIYINLLGEMKFSKEGNKIIKDYGINHDSYMIFDKTLNRYYIKLPVLIKKKEVKNRGSICGLDPGEKVFMTYYSTQDTGYIGENMREIILKLRSKISYYQRLIKKKPNKEKKLRIKIRRIFKKIRNKVKELHNKCALYLVKNYNKILVPEFKTSYMITRTKINKEIKEIYKSKKNKEEKRAELKKLGKKRKLSKKVVTVLNHLSHYKFKQHLKMKCLEYGCEFISCTEEYTSKTCSNCGHLNDYKAIKERTLKCTNCKKEVNRDINGSKNILMKYLKHRE